MKDFLSKESMTDKNDLIESIKIRLKHSQTSNVGTLPNTLLFIVFLRLISSSVMRMVNRPSRPLSSEKKVLVRLFRPLGTFGILASFLLTQIRP